MRLLLVIVMCLTAVQGVAQTPEQLEWIRNRTDVSALEAIRQRAELRQRANTERLADIQRRRGLRSTDGSIQLVGFNARGFPVWYTTTNLDAANSIGTSHLWNGGSLGLNLEGQGMTVGEWDNGFALDSHQEFGGRLTQADGATDTAYHVTHVAGTMIAAGVDGDAKGMAPQASLDCYDWSSDEQEMATAAANGLLVSNHSYAFVSGWRKDNDTDQWRWYGDTTVSATDDYSFGRYSSAVQEWDEIANAAPYYLIVKAAANDRNDDLPNDVDTHYVYNSIFDEWRPSTTQRNPDGPYDCLPARGNAKNVLTVGAVDDFTTGYTGPASVSMSSFSSWGPTDDGRIKPDICGNGVGLYSTSDDGIAEYGTSSGTSMAGPNVAGSALLLQQRYSQLHGGAFMQAATLKALLIQTADETGSSIGPDYTFGWGVMNTRKAALFLNNLGNGKLLEEDTLQNGETQTFDVVSNGCEPLKVTVVWNDPAAMPMPAALDDRTSMLVNDIDVRVTTPGGAEYFPWKLNPDSPDVSASRNDNTVDNVEQVFIPTPSAGTHTITIRHKDNLQNGQQPFAILVSGLGGGQLTAGLPATVEGCGGQDLTLAATPGGGNPPYNYTWISGTAMDSTLTVNEGGEYYFQITDQTGCTEIDTIAVQYVPEVDLGANRSICEGLAVTLDAGNPGSNFTWNTGDAGQTITVSDSGAYSVTVTDANGCVATDEVTLSVSDEVPSQDIEALGATDICEGQFVVLSAPAGFAYAWSTGDTTRAIVAEETGLYDVMISSACTTVTSQQLAVTVSALPETPSIYWQGDQLASTYATNYQWYLDGTAIPGATTRYFAPTATGSYEVEVSNAAGCSALSLPFNVMTVGRTNDFGGRVQRVFPNPTNGKLYIQFDQGLACTAQIVDLAGRQLLTQGLSADRRQHSLDVSALASGVYLLRLQSDIGESVLRIVKQ